MDFLDRAGNMQLGGGRGVGGGFSGGGMGGMPPAMTEFGFPMPGPDGFSGGGGAKAPVEMPSAGGMPITSPPLEWADTTTVMMRNLPNKYTQRMLLTEINQSGFLGAFDFLYLPIDPETNANRGYAFFNFIDPSFAWMFKVQFESRKMNRFNSTKVVSVMPATLQGFEANYAHYASSRVNRGDPAARPLFLREPKQTLGGGGGNNTDGGGGQQNAGLRGPRGRRGDSKGGGRGDQPRPGAYTNGNELAGLAATPYPQSQPVHMPTPAQSGKGAGKSAPLVPKFCPHCGGSIQGKFQFCPQCGASQDFSLLAREEALGA